jgi:hypothetical protein
LIVVSSRMSDTADVRRVADMARLSRMQHPLRFRRRPVGDDQQLTLALSWLSESAFLAAMQERGASALRVVRFKDNRSRLVSLSADRTRLNVHVAFRAAPVEVLDAIAVFASAARANVSYRRAIARMRAWWDTQTAGREPAVHRQRDERLHCCATPEQHAFLRSLYLELNRARFDDRLPGDVPLRLSPRMSRRFGHVQYGRTREGARHIDEIALNVDLLLPGNEHHLVDTLVHEMAHVEAWLHHDHRGHGRIWRHIARRVGCEAKACSDVRIRRRRRSSVPVTTVPAIRLSA